MAGARLIVNGPDFATLPYGLWDSLQQRTPDDPHWQNGVTWQDFCPNTTGMTMYEECITVTGTGVAPPPMPTLTANVTRTDRGATPFSVYAEYDGSPIGLDFDKAAAEAQIARVENYHMEKAFWTGLAAGQPTVWPHLAANALLLDSAGITLQSAASPIVTGGAGAAQALGALEKQLGTCYSGQGYIHVSRSALNALVDAHLINVEDARDGKLITPNGNILVVGGGYPGTSPAGAAPAAGTEWIYATGAVFGYRSEVYVRQMPEDFDRAKNTVKLLAYRTYLLGFECCNIAALVNLPA
jgi:hypothetical protein